MSTKRIAFKKGNDWGEDQKEEGERKMKRRNEGAKEMRQADKTHKSRLA